MTGAAAHLFRTVQGSSLLVCVDIPSFSRGGSALLALHGAHECRLAVGFTKRSWHPHAALIAKDPPLFKEIRTSLPPTPRVLRSFLTSKKQTLFPVPVLKVPSEHVFKEVYIPSGGVGWGSSCCGYELE